MSEFKNGDEVLYCHNNECETYTFVAGPDEGWESCLKNASGHFEFAPHKHLKPKPKTITVEMPKPKWAARPVLSNPERIIVEFDCESDADAALEALKDVINIDPKGAE